ncbi:MAG TPA: molecular chaperone TorD family protein [Rhodocyclaceae bacterium]|nr:molecular chaperone TorD family protein [Rhodocyclaceae bacterium]
MNAPMHPMVQDEDLARADAYAVLARVLFAAPDAGLLAALNTAQREGEGQLTASWNAMCSAAGDMATIADEYAELFVSIGKPQVSLFGSWYLTGFLMEKPLALLRDDLAAMGLVRNEAEHDPEDHIAGELDVMRHLILSGSDSGLNQAQFFQRHLLPWYGDLCMALEQAPSASFYRAVAQFMRVFLDMERDYFALQTDRDGGVK